MKYLHKVSINEATLPRRDFDELWRIKPECRTPSGFEYKIEVASPDGDDFLKHILGVVRRLEIPRRSVSNATHFGYIIMREYEKCDFTSAELLLLNYQRKLKDFDGPERDEQGRLLVIASENKPNLKFGSTWPKNYIIVSDVVRQFLEKPCLVGLQFKPLSLKGKTSHAASAPPWELDSSITLPKISDTQRLMHYGQQPDFEPQPFLGDYSRPVFIDDAPFFGAELHYRRSALATLGTFDIAATFEHYMWPHPALVISQRFYQHCLNHDVPLAVEPVRIDPD